MYVFVLSIFVSENWGLWLHHSLIPYMQVSKLQVKLNKSTLVSELNVRLRPHNVPERIFCMLLVYDV